jgi:hypothetical protein
VANTLTPEEAEAISILQAGNKGAWQVLESYFSRQLVFEVNKCITTPRDRVEVHQGSARTWGKCTTLHKDAQAFLSDR